MVEFDPASPWYNASLTIAATWIRTGGILSYNTFAQPPEEVRTQLKRLGLDPTALEEAGKLTIVDWYTVSLGRKSSEKHAPPSLKVQDITIWFSTTSIHGPSGPEVLIVADNQSVLARFNDEKIWIEFHLQRTIPGCKSQRITAIRGVLRDIHTAWVYRQLESAVDGIVDFKVEERGQETVDLLRIRSMRNVHFDRNWHKLKVGQNFEVTLEK